MITPFRSPIRLVELMAINPVGGHQLYGTALTESNVPLFRLINYDASNEHSHFFGRYRTLLAIQQPVHDLNIDIYHQSVFLVFSFYDSFISDLSARFSHKFQITNQIISIPPGEFVILNIPVKKTEAFALLDNIPTIISK